MAQNFGSHYALRSLKKKTKTVFHHDGHVLFVGPANTLVCLYNTYQYGLWNKKAASVDEPLNAIEKYTSIFYMVIDCDFGAEQGMALLKQIKKHAKIIFIITAIDFSGNMNKIKDAASIHIISKPLKKSALESVMADTAHVMLARAMSGNKKISALRY